VVPVAVLTAVPTAAPTVAQRVVWTARPEHRLPNPARGGC